MRECITLKEEFKVLATDLGKTDIKCFRGKKGKCREFTF
jgi:hypothetical protein